MKILIVDDEEQIRSMVGEFLENEGHQILLAVNGREGLETARREADGLSLIILDNKMPVMSGFEMLQKLRKEGNRVAVIIVTGHSEMDEETLIGQEVLGIIEKPFSLETIKNLIDEKKSQ
ncbi:MAG: response regulator [Deltaproteobacteria bacterium]|nr:response regulator [Deltaproteobacteria bacterium]